MKYHPFLRAIHWLMFILFTILFVLGATMIEFKECCEPWAMYNFHKSTGVLVLLLVFLRLFVRSKTSIPRPLTTPVLLQRVARIVMLLMYTLMILVPVSGYALSNVHGYTVKFYGVPLPTLFPTHVAWETFSSAMHFYLAYLFLICIAIHIVSIIWHHVKGRELLRRMS